MASAGARGYMEVWGRCPQRGLGAEPLVRGSGGLRPPEAEGILLPKRANLSLSFKWNLNFAAIYAEKDRNGVPVIKKRTGTAFRCVPARNEPCTRPILLFHNHRSLPVSILSFPTFLPPLSPLSGWFQSFQWPKGHKILHQSHVHFGWHLPRSIQYWNTVSYLHHF